MPGSKKKGSQPSTRTVMRKIKTTIQNPSTEPRHTRPRADGGRRSRQRVLQRGVLPCRMHNTWTSMSTSAEPDLAARRRWRARPIKDAVMTGPTPANGVQEAEGIWENAEHASHEARSAATCSPMRDCQGQRSKHTPLCSRSIRACTRTVCIPITIPVRSKYAPPQIRTLVCQKRQAYPRLSHELLVFPQAARISSYTSPQAMRILRNGGARGIGCFVMYDGGGESITNAMSGMYAYQVAATGTRRGRADAWTWRQQPRTTASIVNEDSRDDMDRRTPRACGKETATAECVSVERTMLREVGTRRRGLRAVVGACNLLRRSWRITDALHTRRNLSDEGELQLSEAYTRHCGEEIMRVPREES
ncbi:hypothetical protein B0H19DRAFT_1060310 [Mycena capillaripes]|nr:hypothetical protein B0H19DRAFT_1060310 [Mycena capillaripes]